MYFGISPTFTNLQSVPVPKNLASLSHPSSPSLLPLTHVALNLLHFPLTSAVLLIRVDLYAIVIKIAALEVIKPVAQVEFLEWQKLHIKC